MAVAVGGDVHDAEIDAEHTGRLACGLLDAFTVAYRNHRPSR